MSNIYIQEPPTSGKVVLVTSVGEIDVELWSKETPKACRNFIQLCMEGYYDDVIFHRVVKGFIVQGGDPTGTGHGGESIYGKTFKDEFHSRLRFTRRGLLAMANAGPDDNGSQFFFTLGAAPELNKKHTIFGKVTGDTLYNMLKLEEADVDANERPTYPQKITKTKVLANPFDDIIPRVLSKRDRGDDQQKKKKSKAKATKNFKLLSFGDEAEEDEEETDKVSKNFRGKGKSSHDLLDDKKLSSVPAVEGGEKKRPADEEEESDEDVKDENSDEEDPGVRDRIRKKLKKDHDPKSLRDSDKTDLKIAAEEVVKLSKTEELKREVKQLQKELNERKRKAAEREKGKVKVAEEETKKEPESGNDMVESLRAERKKYKEIKKTQSKKGSDREAQTLAMLAKFQNKLSTARQLTSNYGDDEEEEEEAENEEEEDTGTDMSWMGHTLKFEDNKKKVLDANVHDADRYEIFDPRNPMTKRRREASKKSMKSKR